MNNSGDSDDVDDYDDDDGDNDDDVAVVYDDGDDVFSCLYLNDSTHMHKCTHHTNNTTEMHRTHTYTPTFLH